MTIPFPELMNEMYDYVHSKEYNQLILNDLKMIYYLITYADNRKPFISKWFNKENFEPGMIVYNISMRCYTTDGEKWENLPVDNL